MLIAFSYLRTVANLIIFNIFLKSAAGKSETKRFCNQGCQNCFGRKIANLKKGPFLVESFLPKKANSLHWLCL